MGAKEACYGPIPYIEDIIKDMEKEYENESSTAKKEEIEIYKLHIQQLKHVVGLKESKQKLEIKIEEKSKAKHILQRLFLKK